MDAIILGAIGFITVSCICIGLLMGLLYLIRESKIIMKKLDAVTQKLIDIKYR